MYQIPINEWPFNLYYDIVGQPVEENAAKYADDFYGSLLYAVHAFLTNEEIVTVLGYYRDQLPIKDVANSIGKPREKTRVILNRSLRKLRTPECAKYILHGVQVVERSAFERGRQEGYDIGYHDGYQVCKAEIMLKDEKELARWDRIRKTFPQFVNMLDIGYRAKNALRAAGITEVDVLLSLTEHQLNSIPGVGEKTASEIIRFFKAKGFSMRPECLPAGLDLRE